MSAPRAKARLSEALAQGQRLKKEQLLRLFGADGLEVLCLGCTATEECSTKRMPESKAFLQAPAGLCGLHEQMWSQLNFGRAVVAAVVVGAGVETQQCDDLINITFPFHISNAWV